MELMEVLMAIIQGSSLAPIEITTFKSIQLSCFRLVLMVTYNMFGDLDTCIKFNLRLTPVSSLRLAFAC